VEPKGHRNGHKLRPIHSARTKVRRQRDITPSQPLNIRNNKKRKTKGETLYKHVMNHTARFWSDSFIKALQLQFATSSIENSTDIMHQVRCSPAELTRTVLTSYHGKLRRVLVFGFDGILVPYSKYVTFFKFFFQQGKRLTLLYQTYRIPELVAPSQRLLESLQKLIRDPNNIVVVMR